jgi:hypothetical protein
LKNPRPVPQVRFTPFLCRKADTGGVVSEHVSPHFVPVNLTIKG